MIINNTNKVLFTSYMCNENDDIVQTILRKWKELNPSFKIFYFSDDDIDVFFKNTEYEKTYKCLKNGVAKADFFRICYIEKNGGYWFDIDLDPVNIDFPNIGNIHLFDAGYKKNRHHVCSISYMLIGGSKNQLLFKDVIKEVSKRIIKNYNTKITGKAGQAALLDITGPHIIQEIVFEKLNNDPISPEKGYKTYLENTEYEFQYMRILFLKHKTTLYDKLQKRYNKLPHQHYDFI